ncbi:glycoside hydrolase superfamily [Haematococcus lacustris]
MSAADDFVRVEQGSYAHFKLRGQPWRFVGANCYYLMTRGADPSLADEVTQVLDAAQASGFTVLRTWAFADGEQWNAAQPAAGQYNEVVLRALDWVLAECQKRGIRLLLGLTNYWHDYGGLQQYVRWAQGLGPGTAVLPEAFYTCPEAQAMWQGYVQHLLTRTNSRTGVAYRDDPTILGWEVVNEPRCEQASGVPPEAMRAWLSRAVAAVKALAPRHLITVGCDGFFGPASPELQAANPYPQCHGCDWAAEGCCPGLDFLCCHMYPDHWLPAGSGAEAVASFTTAWLDAHVQVARQLNKPLVLSEFGSHALLCCKAGTSAAHGPGRHQEGKTMGRPEYYHLVLSHCFGQLPVDPSSPPLVTAAAAAAAAAALAGPAKGQVPDQSEVPWVRSARMQAAGWASSVLGIALPPAASSVTEGCGVHGALLWMLAAPSYPDYDGFTLYPVNAPAT